MNHQSIKPNFLLLREVANGIWNYATSLLFLGGLVDVGTHMSISKLSSGRTYSTIIRSMTQLFYYFNILENFT
jgi:hypothetical protein